MMRRDWYALLGVFLLFWVAGGWVLRPVIEQALTERAQQEVSELEGVSVMFRGQQAVLRGEVRWESLRTEAESRVKEGVRASTSVAAGTGGGLNPVTDVVNEIVVSPFEPGWLMLLSAGSEAKLLGVVATDEEARDLGAAIKRSWEARGGNLDVQVRHELSSHDEASRLGRVLSAVPRPPPAVDVDAAYQIWAAKLGQGWERWTLGTSMDVLYRDAQTLGVSAATWKEVLEPEINGLAERRRAEKARLAEEKRLAALPPPHVVAALAGDRLLLRGEFGSAEAKTTFLSAMLDSNPGKRVLDDLRVSAARRPKSAPQALRFTDGDSGEQVRMLIGDKRSRLPADLDDEGWVKALPTSFKQPLVKQLRGDLRVAKDWMKGGNAGIPDLPAPEQPAFLTLAILEDRVLIGGQLAEEAHRSYLLEAAERAYGSTREIDAETLRVRGNCERTEAILHTAMSLPPAKLGIVLAVAKPGEEWRRIAITGDLLRKRRVSAEQLPAGVPGEGVSIAWMDVFDRLQKAAPSASKEEGGGR